MYTKKDGSYLYQGGYLSDRDSAWINYFFLPYVARSVASAELATTVYKTITAQEKIIMEICASKKIQ
ncbi:hypothetical protein BDD43_5427 [Mucilaginibacter gracilis]|uniref:Uncharacterized protein n=1 Tax=Mucilaginibacter gracilis TaxID=423350 RepID=A0A495J847_9SPHI|nr:hypothetical protein BDD43_5427 [Mucilaginibacter gracilis]